MLMILGRTGSGKSTVVRHLKNFSPIVSYADRPPRADETEGVEHHFLTKEAFDQLKLKAEVIAYTEINGTRYMATRDQVKPNSVYVIDPKGLMELQSVGDYIVYIYADEETRRDRCSGRDYDFEGRNADEDGMFSDFESMGVYDLWLDSTKMSPEELAAEIERNYKA